MKEFCLGMDTSCYTTSVALCCGEEYYQKRRLLDVELGQRGLRQSEAVFQHVNHMPALWEALRREHPDAVIGAVCASTRPRPRDGSYMPVFTAGEGFARCVAAALGVPFFETSHQEGHIRAARTGLSIPQGPMLAVHLSGGTTEVVYTDGERFDIVGKTLDISAGQLIDRVGVALGLSFPAGPEMERLAREGEAASKLSVRVKNGECSLSGAEAETIRMREAGAGKEDVAAEVFSCVARTLCKMLTQTGEATGARHVLLAGGVAGSMLLRGLLQARLKRAGSDLKIYWADPALAGDNAVGVAEIGYEKMMGLRTQGGKEKI